MNYCCKNTKNSNGLNARGAMGKEWYTPMDGQMKMRHGDFVRYAMEVKGLGM